jgi:hypothetical protein
MPQLDQAAASRGEARIVYITSGARFQPMTPDLPFGGKHFEKVPPNTLGGNDMAGPTARYVHSKFANLAYTLALSEKLAASRSKVKVLCADPGAASTSLQNNGLQEANLGVANCIHWMLFHPKCCGILQSGGDGSCPMIIAAFYPDANSGDLYVPLRAAWFAPLYTNGYPKKTVAGGKMATGVKGKVYKEPMIEDANKKAAYDATRKVIDNA